ncbi:MAG: fused MFS/spermidine synthase [Pseudomonadota bacterium]
MAEIGANRARRWALALMVASGFAALGYQIVWTQQATLLLGHEAAAVLAVVAAFFGGIGLGALALGPRIDASARPARWYAACEAVIALWSLALVFLMPPASSLLFKLSGTQPSALWHWSVVFCGTSLLLLPATFAMGATLPAMERILGTLRDQGTPIPILYAGNTFGAVLGVLATAFFLIPMFGLTVTASICVMTNLCCAAASLKVFAVHSVPASAGASTESRRHLAILAATGFLGIGYEVLVVRVLSQVAENTVYTFAILLAVYLVGSALGAAAYGHWGERRRLKRDHLLQSLSFACVSGIVVLVNASAIKSAALATFGAGMGAALGVEALLATATFLLPTFVMGALFSHLAIAARGAGISFGRALGANTLGAALAPWICGVMLLPRLGSTYALAIVAAGYLLLIARRSWAAPAPWAALSVGSALAIWAPSLALVDVPAGGHLVSYAEGVGAAVSVVADADGVETLHINNRQQEGSSATLFADARQGLLPILLHPAPRRALFLGLGTGLTAKSASEDAEVQVDAVELLPEVIAASDRFEAVEPRHPRLRMIVADARRFVRAAPDLYDVIVADNYHPARSGSGSLYTVEHFAAVRERLAPGGIFCQWLPLHQLDLETLRSIVQSYRRVYPRGWAMLATNSLETPVLGLVSRRDGERFALVDLRGRLASARLPRPPQEFGIADDLALLGGFIAGPEALTSFAGDAPLNTDDRPVVSYRAPRITYEAGYAAAFAPRDRLLSLLHDLSIRPGELLAGEDGAWMPKLAAYWRARDRYLDAGRTVRPTRAVQEMLAQVQAPLLSVLEISPDFRPAYDPLMQMAVQLERTDMAAARALLVRLAGVQPARSDALEALRELDR